MSLFVPTINTGEGSFTAPGDDSEGEYMTCPVLVGDEVIGERTPRLIKIDVEGFEGHVLKGLTRTLKSAKPIVCMEMIAGHLARDGQTPESLSEWLERLGYAGKRLELANRHELALLPMPRVARRYRHLRLNPILGGTPLPRHSSGVLRSGGNVS